MINALLRASQMAGLQARAEGYMGMDPQGYTIIRGDNPTEYQRTGRNVRIMGFERHPVVHACARVISDIGGSVNIEAFRKDEDGDEEVVPNYPGVELLDRPRVMMSGTRLRKLTIAHFVTYGNAFWLLEREDPKAYEGPIAAIRLIHPEEIQYVYLDPDTLEVMWYRWRDRVGRSHMTIAYNMVHFKDLCLGDWIFGFPRGAAALVSISSDDEASQYVRQIVKNSGSPGAIVKVPDEYTDKQLRAAKKRFDINWVKRGGRGGTAFMRGVEEYLPIGFNLEQLEFPELRSISRQDICSAFGVDPRMVGSAAARGNEGGLSGAQYEEARRRLMFQTVIPVMDDIEAELNEWLAPEFGDAILRFSPDEKAELTENKQETSIRVLSEVTGRIRTREEARRAIKLDDKPDPKDTWVASTEPADYPVEQEEERAKLKMERIKNPPPSPFDMGGGNKPPFGKEKEGDDEAVDEKEKKEDEVPAFDRATARFRTRSSPVLTREQKSAIWAYFDSRAKSQEERYDKANRSLFAFERGEVADYFGETNFGRSVMARAADSFITEALARIMADYRPGGKFHTNWLERYLTLTEQSFGMAAKNMAGNGQFDFTISNPRVQAQVQLRARKLADYVTQTTSDQISSIVGEGIKQGLGRNEIAEMIDLGVFKEQAPERARMIAQTESIGSLNQGEYVTATESGYFTGKEWLTQGDDRVREAHDEHEDMGVVDIDYEFAPGLKHPGDQRADGAEVINCRCSLLYYSGE